MNWWWRSTTRTKDSQRMRKNSKKRGKVGQVNESMWPRSARFTNHRSVLKYSLPSFLFVCLPLSPSLILFITITIQSHSLSSRQKIHCLIFRTFIILFPLLFPSVVNCEWTEERKWKHDQCVIWSHRIEGGWLQIITGGRWLRPGIRILAKAVVVVVLVVTLPINQVKKRMNVILIN